MSAAIEVGDHITARLEFQGNSSDVGFNVLWYRVGNVIDTATGAPSATAVPNSVALPAIAEAVYNHLKDEWQFAACVQATFTSVTAQSPYPLPRSRPYTFVPAVAEDGAIAGELLPSQDCPTILKRTDFGQRWGMGRLFFFGLGEAQQDNGLMTNAAVGLVNAFAAKLVTTILATVGGQTISLTPVLVKGTKAAVTRSTPLTDAALSNAVIKTQRRRRPGKGI
jgi:hypothetical protein